METLLHKKKYRANPSLNKTAISPSRNIHSISNLIEELDANLVVLKPISLKDDWSNFTKALGAGLINKISL